MIASLAVATSMDKIMAADLSIVVLDEINDDDTQRKWDTFVDPNPAAQPETEKNVFETIQRLKLKSEAIQPDLNHVLVLIDHCHKEQLVVIRYSAAQAMVYSGQLATVKKNHNSVAVSGHPNPTHSPTVPGGAQKHTRGRIQKCTGVGTQKHTGGT